MPREIYIASLEVPREPFSQFSTDALITNLDLEGGTSKKLSGDEKTIWQRPSTSHRYGVLNEAREILLNEFRIRQGELIRNLISEENRFFLMEGTGFDVVKQLVNFYEMYFSAPQSAEDFENVKKKFGRQVEEDLSGYFWEFVAREPVLKINLEITSLNGKRDVVSPYYGKKLLETVSSLEREGATKEGIQKLVEKLLCQDDGVYIIASPKGWSGVKNENGLEMEFPESQMYVYIKVGGKIEAYTFRNNLTLNQYIELAESQGINLPDDAAPTNDLIKALVSTPISFCKDGGFNNLIENLKQITGGNIFWTDSGNEWSFENVLERLTETRDIWSINEDIRTLISKAKDLVLDLKDASDNEISNLAIELGKIALLIRKTAKVRDVRSISSEVVRVGPQIHEALLMTKSDFRIEAKSAQMDDGCVGKVSADSAISSPFGPRNAVASGEKTLFCCTCPFCKKQVEAEIYGGRIHCPKCGRSADWKSN